MNEKNYDFSTKNKSFLSIHKHLLAIGIDNNKFFLEIIDVDLVGIDPHDENLSEELQNKIRAEIYINPWYYFREVLIIPSEDGKNTNNRFILTLNNLSLIWCYINNLDTYTKANRRCFKTRNILAILSYHCIFMIKTELKTKIIMNTRDYLHNDILIQLLNALPAYLEPYKSTSRKKKVLFIDNNIRSECMTMDLCDDDLLSRKARSETSNIQIFDDCDYNGKSDIFCRNNAPVFYTNKDNSSETHIRFFTSTMDVQWLRNISLPFTPKLFDIDIEFIIKSQKLFNCSLLYIDLEQM